MYICSNLPFRGSSTFQICCQNRVSEYYPVTHCRQQWRALIACRLAAIVINLRSQGPSSGKKFRAMPTRGGRLVFPIVISDISF